MLFLLNTFQYLQYRGNYLRFNIRKRLPIFLALILLSDGEKQITFLFCFVFIGGSLIRKLYFVVRYFASWNLFASYLSITRTLWNLDAVGKDSCLAVEGLWLDSLLIWIIWSFSLLVGLQLLFERLSNKNIWKSWRQDTLQLLDCIVECFLCHFNEIKHEICSWFFLILVCWCF